MLQVFRATAPWKACTAARPSKLQAVRDERARFGLPKLQRQCLECQRGLRLAFSHDICPSSSSHDWVSDPRFRSNTSETTTSMTSMQHRLQGKQSEGSQTSWTDGIDLTPVAIFLTTQRPLHAWAHCPGLYFAKDVAWGPQVWTSARLKQLQVISRKRATWYMVGSKLLVQPCWLLNCCSSHALACGTCARWLDPVT